MRLRKRPSEMLGIRTGKNVLKGKIIRKTKDGTDVFEDYFTDSSHESEKQKSPRKPAVVHQNSVAGSNNEHEQLREYVKDISQAEEYAEKSMLMTDSSSLSCLSFKIVKYPQSNKICKRMRKQNGKKDADSEGDVPNKKSQSSIFSPPLVKESTVPDVRVRRKSGADHFTILNWLHDNSRFKENSTNSEIESVQDSPLRGQSKSAKKKQAVHKSKMNKFAGVSESVVRRSDRIRCAPLDFWRNERLLYRFTESGGIESMGLEHGSKDHCAWNDAKPKQPRQIYKRRKNHEAVKRPTATNEKHDESRKTIRVIDPETEEQVKAKVVFPYKSLTWKKPDPSKHMSGFTISKTIHTVDFSFGFIRIQGMNKKPTMLLKGYDVTFIILQGKIEITIHNTVMILEKMDTFLVPDGNTYSLQNLLSTEASLTYMATVNSFLQELKI